MSLRIEPVENASLLAEAMALVQEVFIEFVAPDYVREGVDTFLAYIATGTMEKRINAGEITMWCAKLNGIPAGVIAMRPPRAISLLFVDKKHHKKGIAKSLLARAPGEYPGEGGPATNSPVTVNASPYAAEIYKKLGFTEAGQESCSSGIRSRPMVYNG